jgi:hypothetical protein
MADPKYIMALIVVLSMDVVLLMAQFGMADINPGGNFSFITYQNSSLSKYDAGGFVLNTQNVSGEIPGANLPVSQGTGEPFTDTFAIFRTWGTVGKFATAISTVFVGPGIYLFNPALGLPSWFAYLISSMWFIITVFLFVMLLTGR